MDDDLEAEPTGDVDGLVAGHVVDEDHVVDEVWGMSAYVRSSVFAAL